MARRMVVAKVADVAEGGVGCSGISGGMEWILVDVCVGVIMTEAVGDVRVVVNMSLVALERC